jgi:GNAT superfamily N-acetyltransferase
VGVFSLTKKGSLLIETKARDSIFEMVLKSCLEESISLTGLVGNWEFCNPFWNFLKNKKVIQTETFNSKEILYSIDLSNVSSLPQPNVRLLTEADYLQWKPLRLDYLMEEGVPNDLTDEQLFDIYLDKVRKKIIWGFFLQDKLISIADLNAKALDLGQVGGVYTIPSFRKKGYSKSVMQQLLLDAKKLHSIRKLIIFTGEIFRVNYFCRTTTIMIADCSPPFFESFNNYASSLVLIFIVKLKPPFSVKQVTS